MSHTHKTSLFNFFHYRLLLAVVDDNINEIIKTWRPELLNSLSGKKKKASSVSVIVLLKNPIIF